MNLLNIKEKSGFTLLELLVVIAIIGILVAIVMMSLSTSQEKGRDAARKAQSQEILKALELYYSNNGSYPTIGGGDYDSWGYLSEVDDFGGYLSRMPDEAGSRYYYCVSANGSSILLAVDTEQDKGNSGSNLCNITRGSSPYGCIYSGVGADIDAEDRCSTRF